ncbi:SulP family inorganic anion transporter, partial [Prosthecobacter sp.]|uniref:SulP family inorganic anion transporter n=1 Tax=Prosthecobacter sp. TaxID=1965333 RepID=UPI001D3BCBDB
IIVMTIIAIVFKLDVRRVGDLGELPDALPVFLWPQVPWTLKTLWIVLPYSAGLAAVGLLESLLTAQIVDEMTDTPSDKNRECSGQGIANIFAGLFGGMAGCAMIGQSVINVKSGGRGRLSTFVAGVFLLILLVLLGPWVRQIPMPVLVAVMIMVSIGTFSWVSFSNMRRHPKSSSIVMIATVLVVVLTHNLALGVGVGVLLSALFFARKVAHFLRVSSEIDESGSRRTYTVVGQLFFASAGGFVRAFDFKEAVSKIRLDVTHAHFWDLTAVASLDKVVLKFRREGKEVEVLGLNEASATLVDRLGVHDKPGAIEDILTH